MTSIILAEAEKDLEHAFDFYEAPRRDLGRKMLGEFRRAVERILEHPGGCQSLDPTYRRCRLHRFPYDVVYRVNAAADQIVIVAVSHLSRNPDWWRDRDRQG